MTPYPSKTPFRPHNHAGPKCLLALGNKVFVWAGSRAEVATKGWDLVIQLCDVFMSKPGAYARVTGTENAKLKLDPTLFSQPQATVWVDWEDFATPLLGRTWWLTLLASIKNLGDGITPVDVAVCCDGGHGRTGSAITILGCLGEVIPVDADPVAWVRENYCDQCVETEGQIEYIERVTDRTIHAGPSSFLNSGGFGTEYTWTQNEAGNWVRHDTPLFPPKSAQSSAAVFNAANKEKHYGYTEADFGYGDDPEDDDEIVGTDEDGNVYKLQDGRVVVVDTLKPGQSVDEAVAEWKTASVGKVFEKAVGNAVKAAFTPAPALIGPGATSPLRKPVRM